MSEPDANSAIATAHLEHRERTADRAEPRQRDWPLEALDAKWVNYDKYIGLSSRFSR